MADSFFMYKSVCFISPSFAGGTIFGREESPINNVVLLSLCAVIFAVVGLTIYIGTNYSLNRIKNKRVGDGQHGTARWATKKEIAQTYEKIIYDPTSWRQGRDRPTPEQQGLVVACLPYGKTIHALVETGDVHTLMISASGTGKTAYFLYPNIEYACACGMSYITTDTKGDVYRKTAGIAQKYYGYKNVHVIDLRNPTRSHGYNMLYLVNKYMTLYKQDRELSHKAKAEKYAKITAKTIINSGIESTVGFGQNQFFYEAAEGVITSTILLVAEFCEPKQRHIVSVFKLIQELLAPSPEQKKQNQFQTLIKMLPPDHKARWFAGAALSTGEQAMASALSTALSRLNAFLDSELEQILCFDTSIDMERFCAEKSAIYLVLPEEDATKHFLVSLIIEQVYREMLVVADEHGGQLENRVMIYADELGTLPKISSLDMIFSASRSRRCSIVPIIQSIAQLEQTYGKEGAEIIIDNCQCTIIGGFAPQSQSAEAISKSLGTQTVMSGTVSNGRGDPSRSLQMIERPLMTTDELKCLPKGRFIVMRTGAHPMQCRLLLFTRWGIKFEDDYVVDSSEVREVEYANKDQLECAIIDKYIAHASDDKNDKNRNKICNIRT